MSKASELFLINVHETATAIVAILVNSSTSQESR